MANSQAAAVVLLVTVAKCASYHAPMPERCRVPRLCCCTVPLPLFLGRRVLSGKPTLVPCNATFSVVAGSHTHYFAAESQREAELWVCVIREAWLHCFSHTARCTGGSAGGMTVTAAGVAVSQKLMAENALLRESIQELNQQVTQANGEYWR